MKPWWILGSLIVMASLAQAEDRRVPVQVAQAVALEEAPRIWVPGTVMSRQDAMIGAELAGKVITVAEPGTRVPAGAVLALLDDRAWQFDLREARSRIARLEARLAFLDKEMDRLSRLDAADSVARNQVDELETERAMVREDHALAVVERDRAAYRIEQARLTAPYAGQVVERLSEQGEFAQVGQSVVRLVNLDDREVRATAPLRVAPHLRDGQPVPIRHQDGAEPALLAISTIIPVGDLDSRSFELRLRLAEERWPIGAPVEVGLPTAPPRSIVAVPRDALVLRDDRTLVFRVNGEGVAQRLAVATGIGIGELIEIDGAIGVGDRVVIQGAETLRDGQTVSLIGH